jgi:DNA invertase Pin-like site-specific DNA recombinase
MTGKRLPQDYAKYEAMEELVASGMSVRQICKQLNADSRTVLKYFPAAGGRKGGGNGKMSDVDPARLKLIGKMVADGASLNEIMRTAHTDHRTIKRYFPNAGWKRRGGSGASMMKKANDILGGGGTY